VQIHLHIRIKNCICWKNFTNENKNRFRVDVLLDAVVQALSA